MKEMLQAVMAKLKKDIPQLRWVSINVGQMNVESPPVEFPCALVDVPRMLYKNLSTCGSYQSKELTVEVELYFIVRASAAMSAPELVREQALEHLDIMEQVYIALHRFRYGDYSPLECTGIARGKEYYPRNVTLTFSCISGA
jgi:hypothetical protein